MRTTTCDICRISEHGPFEFVAIYRDEDADDENQPCFGVKGEVVLCDPALSTADIYLCEPCLRAIARKTPEWLEVGA